MSAPANATGIGRSVRRREDPRLLSGKGRYSDDLNLAGQAYAIMVRSPHAHARLGAIDTAAARAVPGVLAVLTGADMLADGLHPIPHAVWSRHPAELYLPNSDGSQAFIPRHHCMATEEVRHVGEIVAVVVAETVAAAKDAAELVQAEYEPLPAVIRAVESVAPDAPNVRGDGGNICVDSLVGDPAATEAAFARAAYVASLTTWIPRVTGVPMEPRAALGTHDPDTERYTLHAGAGGAVQPKQHLAAVLGVAENNVRMVMHDVGGNFGTRGAFNPEFAMVVWAARRVGRPVKWTCMRSEAFVCDYQARDLEATAELALDADGDVSGAARLGDQQCRRVPNFVRANPEGCGDHLQHLPRARGVLSCQGSDDQYAADAAVSQLRPAGGDVRHGAADRYRRPPQRHRPHRIAAAEPDPRNSDAVPQPVRHGL